MVKSKPSPPDLNVLVFADYKITEASAPPLKMPQPLMAQYYEHPRFRESFQNWIKESEAKIYLNKPRPKDDVQGPPTKKPRIDLLPNKEPEPLKTMLLSEVPSPLVHDIDIVVGKNKLSLQIAAGHKIYLSNGGSESVLLKQHDKLVGYFKGKWENKRS